jgi:hypothetical protein
LYSEVIPKFKTDLIENELRYDLLVFIKMSPVIMHVVVPINKHVYLKHIDCLAKFHIIDMQNEEATYHNYDVKIEVTGLKDAL